MEQPENAEYTIGWICALPKETVAARAFLDETYEERPRPSDRENNAYTLGRIGHHKIVIATLAKYDYGTTSATAVVKDMIHTYQNIRMGLVVGVAGGAPSEKNDIRLGDVVVCCRNRGVGGILQVDYGIATQDRPYELQGHLNQMPQSLSMAVASLEADYYMKDHNLQLKVEKAMCKFDSRGEFERPPPTSDRLFKSDVKHPEGSDKSCSEVCNHSLPNGESLLVGRSKRESNRPTIHYGTMASSNTLVKDAHLRDRLASDHGILCFEMEAAGVMNQLDCLVVRGICDYSDTHKNLEWQGHAAMVAAAYATDLIRKLGRRDVESREKLKGVLDYLEKS